MKVISLVAWLCLAAVSAAAAQELGRWSSGAAMPSARSEVAVAALEGRVYVVGGFGGGRALEIYDPAADRWSRGAPMPRAVHHPAAVAVAGKLYVVGGFAAGWSPIDSLYAYDPKRDSWQSLAPLPTARGALAAVVLGGRIHVLGGMAPGRRNTPAHEVYDPASDSWSERAPLPTARDHLAAAVLGGRIYALGGRLGGSYGRNLSLTEAYDPATDSWRRRAPMPTARSGIAAAILIVEAFHTSQRREILVFGGEAPAGTFDEVEGYDPSADRWTAYRPMPTARHGLGAAALGGHVYVISGGATPGGSASALNEIFRR